MPGYPSPLETLINHFQKLPGVGRKTAERFAFKILNWRPSDCVAFGECLSTVREKLASCATCGALMEETCAYCAAPLRDQTRLCIVATAKDIFAIESTHQYNGLYHVLGALLSPLDGIHPESLFLSKLKKRLDGVEEVIIALDSTLEGDTTALFLQEELKGIPLTRLAFGIPIGSSIDYVDEGTLSQAFSARTRLRE